MDVKKLLLRPVEVAESLGICRSKAYALIGRGEIPSIKVDGSVRVPSDALEKWVITQVRDKAEAAGR